MIISNGFPGLPLSMVKIGAYICGFNLFQIQPSFLVLGEKYTIQHFKADIVNAYTTAGLKVFPPLTLSHPDLFLLNCQNP